MIESLFSWKRVQERHRTAPLLYEREAYLLHLQQQGIARKQLSGIAARLLQIIRSVGLTELRPVSEEEILVAAASWAADAGGHISRPAGPGTERLFRWSAMHWLSFHRVFVEAARPKTVFFEILKEFVQVNTQRGLSPVTVRGYSDRAVNFLIWYEEQVGNDLSVIQATHVFTFLEEKVALGWLAQSRASMCQALRSFFRYAEARGLCRSGIARCIKSPRLPKYEQIPKGPAWRDVRRLIESTRDDCAADTRACPVLLLCAIYGMRATEVARLSLDDIDWRNETITIRRAKRGRVQQFPLQYEVGQAIIGYLQNARPRCEVRNVFVTLTRPYRAIRSQAVWTLVGERMRTCGIRLPHVGPHSLRHACATQLLKKGSSLQEIADFLGHRDMKSVSTYARHDPRMLRNVSEFSLSRIL